MRAIQMVDLKQQYLHIKEEIDQAVLECAGQYGIYQWQTRYRFCRGSAAIP